ncbi:hypothetical protein D3C72_2582030 [compost metagenome]
MASHLPLLLETGEGVARDLPAAGAVFRKAAAEGDAFAQRKFAELSGASNFETAMLDKTGRIK